MPRELRCHPQTVRERLVRFNAEGVDGLGDLPGGGRKPRLTEAERSRVLALAASTPPGRLERGEDGVLEAADEDQPGEWTLDTLTEAARRGGHPHRAQPGPPDLPRRAGPLAPDPHLDDQPRPGVRPKRTRIVALHTCPPAGATVLDADELGPVIPRTFPPAPGWAADGHRIKVPLEYSRGDEKVWVYGALRERDGQALTFTAPSRNTAGYLRLLQALARANPRGPLFVITDNLSSHKSPPIIDWLATHPRIQQVFIPKGACWLNLQEPRPTRCRNVGQR